VGRWQDAELADDRRAEHAGAIRACTREGRPGRGAGESRAGEEEVARRAKRALERRSSVDRASIEP
jgi:hypothetical protein